MILRWLALIPAVARLLADLEQAHTEKLVLQDRLAAAENDRSRVWDEMQSARAAERQCLHMLINIEYQRHYGIAPYPDDPKLPPSTNTGGPPSVRMTASQAVEAQINNVVREIQGRLAKQ